MRLDPQYLSKMLNVVHSAGENVKNLKGLLASHSRQSSKSRCGRNFVSKTKVENDGGRHPTTTSVLHICTPHKHTGHIYHTNTST